MLHPSRGVLVVASALALGATALGQTCPSDDALEDNDSCAAARPLTGGVYPNLAVRSNDEDFYLLRVMPYETLRVDIDFSHLVADLDLYLYEPAHPQCGDPQGSGVVAASATLSNHESVTFLNSSDEVQTLVAHVDWYWQSPPGCNDYVLTVSLTGPCPGQDTLEPNDTCGAAVPIGAGTFAALALVGGDEDHFAIDVGDGDVLSVDVWFRHADGDLDVHLLGAGCTQLVGASVSVTDDEHAVLVNATGATQTYWIRLFQAGTTGCVDYTMRATVEGCGLVPDDSLEDNDDCATAAHVVPGFYPLLEAFHDDEDYFHLVVPAGDLVRVELEHDAARGDLDVYAFLDTDPHCGDLAFGWVAASRGVLNREQFEWVNTTGQAAGLVLFVDWFPARPGCNAYDLLISQSPASALGQVFCSGRPNSTGASATLEALGAVQVASNALRLRSEQLPSASFGYFLNARWAGILDPPGSVGQLCLVDGAVGRYSRPGEVRFSGATGTVELALDLTDTPTPLGTTAIAAGETWSFQYWYRDLAPGGGATSNLSDAVRVRFE